MILFSIRGAAGAIGDLCREIYLDSIAGKILGLWLIFWPRQHLRMFPAESEFFKKIMNPDIAKKYGFVKRTVRHEKWSLIYWHCVINGMQICLDASLFYSESQIIQEINL